MGGRRGMGGKERSGRKESPPFFVGLCRMVRALTINPSARCLVLRFYVVSFLHPFVILHHPILHHPIHHHLHAQPPFLTTTTPFATTTTTTHSSHQRTTDHRNTARFEHHAYTLYFNLHLHLHLHTALFFVVCLSCPVLSCPVLFVLYGGVIYSSFVFRFVLRGRVPLRGECQHS